MVFLQALTRSVRGQLVLAMLGVVVLALLTSGIALAVYDASSFTEVRMNDLQTQATLMARANAPALSFDDPEAARKNLELLRERPIIRYAALFAASGRRVAEYRRPGSESGALPAASADAAAPGARPVVVGDTVQVARSVVEDGEQLGTLVMSADFPLAARIRNYMAILGLALLASLGVAFVAAVWLQAQFTRPLLAMTRAAGRVMRDRDFSVRVRKDRDDEIGSLVEAFNTMVDEVGRRTEALERSNRDLQKETADRRAAEDALRDADRRKDEFIATLAHELRNPLAPIRTGVELLGRTTLSREQSAGALTIVRRQLTHLIRLVDDLLDVSRITTGKLSIRSEPLDLLLAMADAVEASRPLILARGHRFTSVLPEEPVLVRGDRVRLAQVFGNLLTNAAKYTPAGGNIELRIVRSGDSVAIVVADDGDGIAPEALPTIFEMFRQSNQSLQRGLVGLGIGLTLARRLVQMHGGTLAARSEGLGRGSEFEVRLPLMALAADAPGPAASAHQAAELAAPASPARPLDVLVVDDNVDFADSIAMLLSSLGHRVQCANDGSQAIALAAEAAFAIAFLDIGMPKMDGLELVARLRALRGGASPVLVAITGWGQERDRERTRAAGFDLHLTKPVGLDAIARALALCDAAAATEPSRDKPRAGAAPL